MELGYEADADGHQAAADAEAIAERSGKGQLWNEAAAHLTIMIIGMAADHDRDSLDETTPNRYADQIIAMLHGAGSPLPTRERR
jgi:hypothetical protein